MNIRFTMETISKKDEKCNVLFGVISAHLGVDRQLMISEHKSEKSIKRIDAALQEQHF